MQETLGETSLNTFLDTLSSASPAPGGGSVAALAGALGAALIGMVANLTIGKKNYADAQEEIAALLSHLEALRKTLQELLDADVEAFTMLSQAMKLPRETDDQRIARDAVMDGALKAATDVPLRIAQACVDLMDLCEPMAERGNVNTVSDVGVAVAMAEAGLRSAALNVRTNLAWIKDEKYTADTEVQLSRLLKTGSGVHNQVYALVERKITRK